MEGEDVGGATTRRIGRNAIHDGIVRSVVTYQYALMVQEETVIDSVGKSILKLEASSKSNHQKQNKKINHFFKCHLQDLIDEIYG